MTQKYSDTITEDTIVKLEVAGRLIRLSPERIRQLQKEHYIPRIAPGRVSLVGAVQGYINFLQDVAKKTTKTAADSRVRDARAKEIEMRNDERMRKLVPVEDATASLDHLVGVIRESMNSIPARVTRDIELRRKIEAEINGAQANIAKALRASADAVETGSELS